MLPRAGLKMSDVLDPMRLLSGMIRLVDNVKADQDSRNIVGTCHTHWKWCCDRIHTHWKMLFRRISTTENVFFRRIRRVENVNTDETSWCSPDTSHPLEMLLARSDPLKPNPQQHITAYSYLLNACIRRGANNDGQIHCSPTCSPELLRYASQRCTDCWFFAKKAVEFSVHALLHLGSFRRCSTRFQIHPMIRKLNICVSVVRDVQKMISIPCDFCKKVPRHSKALFRLRQFVCGASAISHVLPDIVSMPRTGS
jgi:hypothetical protein